MRTIIGVALLSAAAAACIAAGGWIAARTRRDPTERERRRRTLIGQRGRMIDGVVSDYADGIVFYSYSWRGVDYEASQDLRPVQSDLPACADTVIGPATVKFLPADPSNSIVFCETWNGFPRVRAIRSSLPELT
jgi:hypothetical protein